MPEAGNVPGYSVPPKENSMLEDIYYKKTITYNAWKHSFQFKTSQELFSSQDIDLGTKQLLRTVVEADYPN